MAALLCAAISVRAQTALAPPQTSAPAADDPVRQGLALLRQNQPQQALDAFQRALKADPNDASANLLAATAALDLYQGAAAVQYAEKARQLLPNDWRVNTTLVPAYAAAGRTADRDAARATLRKLHDDPKAKDAAQTTGFLLEMFPVKDYRVEAIEYFHPLGKFHVFYRFLVRAADGARLWEYFVQSDDMNEGSWAKAHAEEAASGQRQFSLEGEGGGQHEEYRLFSGDLRNGAGYDDLKAQVTALIQARTTPFPAPAK